MYIDFLKDLIAFQSITPNSSGCIEYISNILEKNGFKTEIKIFGNDDYKVTNLYAVYGNSKPNICFAGHVDVVPSGDKNLWLSNPFLTHILDDKIYGRGTVDMKGAIACFLAASLDFIKSNPNIKGSISFLITSDEEWKAEHGTVEMLKHLYSTTNNLIDLAIVGEPTSSNHVGDTIKIGRRGSINFDLTLYGTAGHVAYPEQANNPIPYLIHILNNLINHNIDQGSEFFQKSNLEITSIDVGNNITNVIPQKITAKFNIRFNDLHTSENIVELIKNIINSSCQEEKIKYDLNYRVSAESFTQEPIGLIADFVKIVTDTTDIHPSLSTSGGTSDARFIKNYCPVVEFGLCYNTAHKINEFTKIIDLQRLYHVYYNSLIKFLI
ncbi:MAG: succinyl-diaminopimelate desuccinylase [Rickettsia endosymbiont of Bryobia graminum]|nr:succinyl-diaminopimelate desuccinylase [Rickettsia endosymbiont of Bryobia graminum]